MTGTRAISAFMLLAVSGCGIDFHPKQAGDTACLGQQVRDFHVEFYRAVDICGTPLPDLTGDFELQQYASAYNISYQYNPRLDALIKSRNWRTMLETGSHIPEDYGLNSAEINPAQ